jgi:hypothetical protein
MVLQLYKTVIPFEQWYLYCISGSLSSGYEE